MSGRDMWTPPATPVPEAALWPRRSTYAAIAAAATAFAVYGSLVPFQFEPMPLAQAADQFRQIRYLTLGVGSRADFVSNILLFIPLGYFFAATLRVDRRGRAGQVAAAVCVPAALAALSAGIEFTQLFFPPRTVSVNDLVAETAGGLAGTVLWLTAGQPVTGWLRAFARERERPALLMRLLLGYTALFLVAQLLPLDITIDVGELAEKYRDGRILVVPFQYAHESSVLAAWDYGGDVVLYAPIGLLARMAWVRRREVRPAAAAFALALAVVAGVELAQIVVFSRYADATDVITGGAGVALGVALSRVLGRRRVSAGASAEPGSLSLLPAAGAAVWMAAILSYHWFPFDFEPRSALLDERLPLMFRMPFSSYYYGSEFHAFTELTRKFLLAVPLGVLVRLAWSPFARPSVARLQTTVVVVYSFVFFALIEAGQIFLVDRTADITDALIAEAGCLGGLWLVARLTAASADHLGATLEQAGAVSRMQL